MNNNTFISDFCSLNDAKLVKQLLNIFDDVDVLYNEGIFFDFAISKGNTDILEALLTYFENKQFPEKNNDYEEAKTKLIKLLKNAIDQVDLPARIKELLNPYIDFEESTDSREHDFDQFDDINFETNDWEQNFNKFNLQSPVFFDSQEHE